MRRQREDRGHEKPDQGQHEQRRVRPGDLLAERLGPVAKAADEDACPHDEQQVADDRARQRGLDDVDESGLQGEERDDQLGDVAERRVEDAADLRAGDRPQPFRRETHDPGKTEDRRGRQHEEERRVGMEAEVEDDGQDAHGDRREQNDSADHRELSEDRKSCGPWRLRSPA